MEQQQAKNKVGNKGFREDIWDCEFADKKKIGDVIVKFP